MSMFPDFRSKVPPKLNEAVCAKLGIDTPSAQQRYEQIRKRWHDNTYKMDYTDIGRTVRPALENVINQEAYLIVFADQVDKLPSVFDQSKKNKAYWLEIAAAFGAEEIGTSLMKELGVQMREINDDTKVLWNIITMSGNTEWITHLCHENRLTEVPDPAYGDANTKQERYYDELTKILKEQYNDPASAREASSNDSGQSPGSSPPK